jgi:ketosteroid isomerase-like protein
MTLPDDEKQIRELVEAKAAALRAGDPRGITAAYAEQVVVFDLAPPLRQHRDFRDPGPVEQWLATFAGPLDYEVRDLDVSVGGDVAFCTSLNRLSGTPAGTDDAFELWHRVTLGLRKVAGRWRITHEHESVPFEMDGSGRASLSLKP